MPSIRSWLFYHLTRRSLGKIRARHLSLPALRAEREAAAQRLFKFPQAISRRAATVGGVPGLWLEPAEGASAGCVLYLHGGAYTTGSSVTHGALAARIALAARKPVLIVNYALAPERPFPGALNDARATYLAMRSQGRGPVALCGDSAGGGLCLALACALRDDGEHIPAALALMSPWTDLTLSGGSHRTKVSVDPYFPTSQTLRESVAAYLGDTPPENPLASPLFANLAGLPPTLIHVGDKEALLDDSLLLAQRAGAQGVEAEVRTWPGMWHVWQVFQGRLPKADRSVAELGAFLNAGLDAAQDAASLT